MNETPPPNRLALAMMLYRKILEDKKMISPTNDGLQSDGGNATESEVDGGGDESPPTSLRKKMEQDLSLDLESHLDRLDDIMRNSDGDGDESGDIEILIAEWQGEIFRASIEKGERLVEAYDCLAFTNEGTLKVESTAADPDTYFTTSPQVLKNSNGEVILTGSLRQIQIALWRGLALKAIIKGDRVVLDALVQGVALLDPSKATHDRIPRFVLDLSLKDDLQPIRYDVVKLYFKVNDNADSNIDQSRLQAIYSNHRNSFWSAIALEYGNNVTPAALEATFLASASGQEQKDGWDAVDCEWYAGDTEMVKAVSVLKELLKDKVATYGEKRT